MENLEPPLSTRSFTSFKCWRKRMCINSQVSCRIGFSTSDDTNFFFFFFRFGPVIEVWLARHPPCFAFVVYRHREDAEMAQQELNGA